MSEPSKAVFLSYASQDAEAVLRIAEALREAGVEVWFDQNELVGGDAWDAKIRGQIASCTLFVPVISANTQARLEGYFRLEWKLAAQRTHAMAEERAFLLPVVIDDTRDAEVKVPAEFKAVQWTRLRGGVGTEKFCARVGKLLGSGIAGVADPSSATGASPDGARGRGHAASLRKPARPWLVPAAVASIGLVLGLGYVLRPIAAPTQRVEMKPAVAPLSGLAPATVVMSPARLLAEKAAALSLKKYNSTADDYAAADGLLKEALVLDQNDAEIWAISSQFNTAIRTRGFDDAPARREAARSQAERALKLDRDSVEGLYALGRWQRDNDPDPVVAEKTFLAVLARAPDHAGALSSLGTMYGRQDRVDEALAMFERAARNPASLALARYGQYLVYFGHGRMEEAERVVRQSIAAEPSSNSVTGLAMVLLTAKGDAPAAVRALAEVPAANRNEHRAVWMTAFGHLAAREPDAALVALRRLSADFVQDNWFTGPTAYWAGRAHAQAGRTEAARIAFEAGLAVMDAKLKKGADDYALHVARGELLAWLGRDEEALREARTASELAGGREIIFWFLSPVRIYAALGRADEAMPLLEKFTGYGARARQWPLTPALLRVDPLWDKLRGDARFQALAAELSAPVVAGSTKAADAKSVAVLAFENRSDDKANEYFSDGIADELLTTLQKIPGLKVSAHTSAWSFKGKNATSQEIGEKLHVANIVEGSVQKSGNRVKITARLSRAATNEEIWSKSFGPIELTDVFATQSELAQAIVAELRGRLTGETTVASRTEIAAQVQAAEKGGTRNVDAHQFYLQGKFFVARGSSEDMSRGVAFFERAVALDASFAHAWVALARARSWQGSFEALDPAHFQQARDAVERALVVVPELAEAHSMMSQLMQRHYFDWRKAREASARALQLAPENADVFADACTLGQILSDWDRSIAAGRRAVALDPVNQEWHLMLSISLLFSGRWPDAEVEIRRTIDLAPTGLFAHLVACQILLMENRPTEALAEARQETGRMHMLEAVALAEFACGHRREADAALRTFETEFSEGCPYQIAEVYAFRGEPDGAFKWLEHAWQIKDPGVGWVRSAPMLRSLRTDSRWPGLLEKFGLSDEQLK